MSMGNDITIAMLKNVIANIEQGHVLCLERGGKQIDGNTAELTLVLSGKPKSDAELGL